MTLVVPYQIPETTVLCVILQLNAALHVEMVEHAQHLEDVAVLQDGWAAVAILVNIPISLHSSLALDRVCPH